VTQDSKLLFKLRWLEQQNEIDRLTTAELVVFVEGEAIWPARGQSEVSLEIQVDDLLAHLTEFWKPLVLRQTFPISVPPQNPSRLNYEAMKRWAELPSVAVEREQELVQAFEEAHNLSNAFAGFFGLPPLWLFRAGDSMITETSDFCLHLPFVDVHDALVRVGDEIANRLLARSDGRWFKLLSAWRNRDEGDPATLVAWSSSLTRSIAKSLIDDGALAAPATVTEAANDNDELRIAARIVSALPEEQIRQVITLVKKSKSHSAPRLETLSKEVGCHITKGFVNHRPFEQGDEAAKFVRLNLGLVSAQFLDISKILVELGVELRTEGVQPPTLDGLAVWGTRHGPAVLVNSESRRVIGRGAFHQGAAARVTLAHELCHLLLDRTHTLSAVDILNGRMPVEAEQRARAFAGEFLLPGRVAADNWFRVGQPLSPKELSRFMRNLGSRYRVPRSVVAWKLEHGLRPYNIDIWHQLDAIVPNR
jgi:hypothetical protein